MIRDWDIVTSYVDSVTTSLKTVTFPKVQEQVKVKNQGNANLTYTIGSQSGTLTPGQSVTVNEDISSFTIQAASGTQAFELRAKEKGTEQMETETDVMSLLAEITQQPKFHFLPVLPIASPSLASGDCSLIVTKTGKTILIDTGASESYPLIKSYLTNIGVTKIDYLIISHYHADHIGNVSSFLSDFNFSGCTAYIQKDSAFTSGSFNVHNEYTNVKNLLNGKTIIEPNNGDTITIDDVDIKFFNCNVEDITYYNTNSNDYNDQSMCCLVTYKNTKVLYTGDIYTTAQTRIYDQGYFENVDLLKVEHHGFNQDVNGDYIQSVQPEYSVTSISISAFISEGLTNDYSSDTHNSGLKSSTLSYLSAIGCKNYVLGYSGGICFTSDGYKVTPVTEKKSHRHSGWSNSFPIWVYVDKNTTVTDSDGTLDKPFRRIQEAISFVGDIPNRNFRIKIADGDYGEDIVITNALGIKLIGNTLNSSAVKLKSVLTYNSFAYFDSLNINGAKNIVVGINESIVQMENCVIDGVPTSKTTYSDGRGICAYNSNVYILNCTISNRSLAIGSYNGAIVSVNNLAGTNNDYVLGAITGETLCLGFTGTFNQKFLVKTNGNHTGTYLKGTTAARNGSVDSNTTGIFRFYDTDLGKDFVWDGTKWIDTTPTVTDWTNVIFQNGATLWGSNPCRYRKISESGHNWLEFELSVQTVSAVTTFFTLPTGFIPPSLTRQVVTGSGGSPFILEIATSGTMQMIAPSGYVFDNTKYAIGKFRVALD